MECLLANFSHDLALSHGSDLYTPPPNVRIMERDLAGLADHFVPASEVSYNACAPVWGWDSTLVSKLKQCGFCNLPSPAQLEKIRTLSSRETAIRVLRELRTELGGEWPVCGESTLCSSAEELQTLDGRFVLKELWSGSGRGLRFVDGAITEPQLNWARRCIKRQGGVAVEPYYNKFRDFALEFVVTESAVEYCGLSVFRNATNNAYAGNLLMPQERLWTMMESCLPHAFFTRLVEVLLSCLRKIFLGNYLGPLGVDMMVVNHCSGLAVHPCVEINVRRTMGMLSLHLADLVDSNSKAEFKLVYDKDSQQLAAMCAAMPKPRLSPDGKLTEGVLTLTPLLPDTHFVALIETFD